MELDVHLTRERDEPWGFVLVGGADYEIPLTIDQVLPSSPAHVAGLQPGDVVARLGDRLATDLSLEAANAIVAEAIGSISFGICRGLYDPVLDDYEPIYEPIERADSDLRSEPTEVLDPQDLSLDDPNILDPRITDPSLWDSGYATRPLTETRSLTASPFLPNTKPYRPFSTEPLQVPPLDDPIILNPNYNGALNINGNDKGPAVALGLEEDDLVRLLPLDRHVEPKFKLPVSDKYDPEWDKKCRAMLEKCAEGTRQDTQQVEKELDYYTDKSKTTTEVGVPTEVKNEKTTAKEVIIDERAQITKEVIRFDETRKEAFDVQKIEQVALEVVEESVERAVSVAEDIKKEIEEELRASMTRELQVNENEVTSETKSHVEESNVERNESITTKREITESLQHKSETLQKSKEKTELSAAEQEEISNVLQQLVDERELSYKKGIEETIDTGNSESKSSAFDKIDTSFTETYYDKRIVVEESMSAGTVKRQSTAVESDDVLPTKKESLKKVSHTEEQNIKLNKEFKSSEVFNNETLKSDGKQKAFMIGLQTIPHIKGFVQSSYHFDLLLRTFFVHLTDVMVALSRFILTQPTQELEIKAEKVVKEKLIKEFAGQDREHFEMRDSNYASNEKKDSESVQAIKEMNHRKDERQEFRVQAKEEAKVAQSELQQQQKETKEMLQAGHETSKSKALKFQEVNYTEQHSKETDLEELETRKKSGSEMAQRTQRKSKDLTQKMNAVITEFENKTGIEDRLEVNEQRNRRSRSRSQIEKEVMKESDPLEWLDKVDSRRASQERTDVMTTEKRFHTNSESKVSKKSESLHESSTTKIKPGKQMYVAVVESHVYTNTDAILEDQVADISETASVQSSKEINAALETFEAVSTENIAMTNFVQSDEKQQAVEVITNAIQEVVQEKQEVLEAAKKAEFKSQVSEKHSESVKDESYASIAAKSTEIISESKLESLKTSDLKETKAVTENDTNFKTAAVELVNVPLEATKEVLIETKATKHGAVAKQEVFSSIAAETTEIVEESKLESFETKEAVTKTAIVSSEDNYKETAQSTTEMILEASKEETTQSKVKGQQAVSNVESLAIAVAESTDVVVDDSKVETFKSQEFVSKKAKTTSEETFKRAAVGVTEIAYEIAEDTHSDVAQTREATVKEQTQHLAVAGIIETKIELCKEPKKPAEDEFASLKIVKEQIIDGEATEILAHSELNVQKRLEVETSSLTQSSISQSISQESNSVQQTSNSMQTTSSLLQETSSVVQASSNSESFKSAKSLHINTNLAQLDRQISEGSDENINTPTPSTVPPTPLTDEYIFKLEIPLPKNQGTVVVEESPDREDPHIVKKGLVPHIETTIEKQIIYDPPLPTPPEDKVQPVYTKPGLRGGAQPLYRKEYIREIERKSSLLASAIDETIKSIEEYKEEVGLQSNEVTLSLPRKKLADDVTNAVTISLPKKRMPKEAVANGVTNGQDKNGEDETHVTNGTANGDIENDVPPGFKPVVFNPEAYQARLYEEVTRGTEPAPSIVKPYVDASGEPLGTVQGIVDGLEDATVDEEVAKELGKPGLTEDKIAVLISGESEMLREAHVMGLTRVITSHMTRPDDSSVDFQKIKPLVPSLKDSEVIKALNEEMKRENEKKKKENAAEAKKWTTFLQKPKRPVPKAKFGYSGQTDTEEVETNEPYKVKIVKQPKPKVAPDYKPEDFETGPLPWEERALNEPVPPPVPPEEPILVPEQAEFFEAVDPLPESEVPDLEDTGIPLPPSPPLVPPVELPPDPEPPEVQAPSTPEPEPEVKEEPQLPEEMDQNKMAEQLVNSVKSMVDPNAPLEQQLCQMRAQLAALAQLPCVIQQSLEMLTRQLSSMSRQDSHHMSNEMQMNMETRQAIHENTMSSIEEYQEETQNYEEVAQNGQEVSLNGQEDTQKEEQNTVTIEEVQEDTMTAEETAALKREQDAMIEEQRKSEKEKKERQEKTRIDQESRQVKQRAPRVGKPRPVFGPLTPEERPVVLPGGRRWRTPKDAYNDQFIAETLTAQAEIIQGKVMGYESDRLPYDDRVNFMKFEKPPVNLDHLQNSATYKLIHNMEDAPLKRTDLLTPVVAEADYRERCRSATPQVNGRM